MDRIDALLLVSFGGPEGPDDVVPFLENVTHGRGISPERLQQVGEHYFRFDGVSPINGQNRRLLAALRVELPRRGIEIPVYWGNRNWSPYILDALKEMRQDGIKRAMAFFTSAYSSYSGCRQYRENLAVAQIDVGDGAPDIERLGPYFNHPGFIEPFVDSTIAAIADLPTSERAAARMLFTSHSIPLAMAESSGVPTGAYVRQHREVARLVAQQVAKRTGSIRQWDLVYQSRSGPPHVPWLEPDIENHLGSLHAAGVRAVVVVPIGFVSDHMEIVWDLDTQAAARAAALGMSMTRARTPGDDPRFVSMVADLLTERIDGVEPAERRRWGGEGASADRCAAECCPNPQTWFPAVGENP